jgi:BirA family transcriptional regulator, biotin operon repressor / biotin---[acetyl-CoA-carboxylase] ligase
MEENILSPSLVQRGLTTHFIGQKVVYHQVVDSTMDAARKEVQWGAPAGTVIIAERQTAGRGRLGRRWISPSGGMAISIILRPNIQYLSKMIMLASVATARGIEKVTGLRPAIKWPNDLRLRQKKVGGILIENDIRLNHLRACIIGIGINVNISLADDSQLGPIATSLSDELGKIVSRLDIIQQLLIEMDRLYQTLTVDDSLFEDWKNRLETIGQTVQVSFGGHIYRGIAESVSDDGALILRQLDGSSIKILAGDVTSRA